MVMKLMKVIATSVTALILLLVVNVIYLFNKFKSYISDIASKSFLEILQGVYDVIPNKNKVGVFIQVLILLFASSGFIVHGLRKDRKSKIPKLSFKAFKKSKTRTDLDNLYKILQERKEVSVGDIERTFEVSNDIAMEWCKILENAELAMIDYPTFKKPVLRIPEAKEEVKKDDEKKISDEDEKKNIKDEKKSGVEEIKVKSNVDVKPEGKKKKTRKHVVKKVVKKKGKPKSKSNVKDEKIVKKVSKSKGKK